MHLRSGCRGGGTSGRRFHCRWWFVWLRGANKRRISHTALYCVLCFLCAWRLSSILGLSLRTRLHLVVSQDSAVDAQAGSLEGTHMQCRLFLWAPPRTLPLRRRRARFRLGCLQRVARRHKPRCSFCILVCESFEVFANGSVNVELPRRGHHGCAVPEALPHARVPFEASLEPLGR